MLGRGHPRQMADDDDALLDGGVHSMLQEGDVCDNDGYPMPQEQNWNRIPGPLTCNGRVASMHPIKTYSACAWKLPDAWQLDQGPGSAILGNLLTRLRFAEYDAAIILA